MVPFHPVPFPLRLAIAIAMVWPWATSAVPLLAQVSVSLDQPSTSREGRGPFLLKPRVDGAALDPGYHLTVVENGELLARFTWPAENHPEPGPGGLQWTGLMATPDAGVHIALNGDGALVLSADSRDAERTFQVRATSREQPSAFRTVTLQVAPGAGAGAPVAESKPGSSPTEGKAAAPLEIKSATAPALNSHIWPIPISAIEQQHPFTASTWDPTTKPPSIVIWSKRNRLVRHFLDGRSETLLDGRRFDQQSPYGWEFTSMAVTSAGHLAFLHAGSPRLWRLDRDGQLKVLAGTGLPESREHYDDEGNLESVPALEAGLSWPATLVACANGDLVFSDRGNGAILRLTPDEKVEVLVGSRRARRQSLNLALRHPAQAFKLDAHRGLAVAPDGTLLFVVNATRIGALAPDGCILRLPYKHHRPIQHLAVTPGQEVVFADAMDDVWLLDRDGQAVQLAHSSYGWFLREEPFLLPKAIGSPGGPPPLDRQPSPSHLEEWGFNDISRLEAVPGGVLVSTGSRSEVAFIGPRHTDHLLVERIGAATAAVEAGRLLEARNIWKGLDKFAQAEWACPATLPDLHVSPLARSQCDGPRDSTGGAPQAPGAALRSAPEAPPLPKALQAMIYRSFPDYRALALRARIAMHLLDRKMRASHSEAWAQVLAP